MIFVTVGTHEQQFNRLIKAVDDLKGQGIIQDDVFIQVGFSNYEPQHCEWKKFVTYSEMEDYMDKANLIITHGGPASFMGAISKGKSPIVVPRQLKYNEHVNDHQLEFCNKVKEQYPIVVVDDIATLRDNLTINDITVEIKSNNQEFCKKLAERI